MSLLLFHSPEPSVLVISSEDSHVVSQCWVTLGSQELVLNLFSLFCIYETGFLFCFELKMYFVLCYVCTILDCFPLIQFLNVKFYLDMYFVGGHVSYIFACVCSNMWGHVCYICAHSGVAYVLCVCVCIGDM